MFGFFCGGLGLLGVAWRKLGAFPHSAKSVMAPSGTVFSGKMWVNPED